MNTLGYKILAIAIDLLVKHAYTIRDILFNAFPTLKGDAKFEELVEEVSSNPSSDTLGDLDQYVSLKGEDPNKLAAVILNKATAEA